MPNLAVAQFRPRKAAYDENLRRVGDLFAKLGKAEASPDLLILPETSLTGYFVEGGVRELAVSADQLFADLTERHRASGAAPIDVVAGFYEVWNSRLYNSA